MHRAVLRVITLIVHEHAVNDLGRILPGRQRLTEQRADAVADETPVLSAVMLRKAGTVQGHIGTCTDILQRIQKRPVEIKNHGANLLRVHAYTPSLLRRMTSASSGVVVET